MITGGANLQGSAFNVNLASSEAINIPNNIRVFMNYRNPDQRGVIYPVPTTPNNSPAPNQAYPNGQGNEGLKDLVLDERRGRLYAALSRPDPGRPVATSDGAGNRWNHSLRGKHGRRVADAGGSRSATRGGQRGI